MSAMAATGGGALLSFGLGSGGERRSFLRKKPQVAKVGERPLFPLLIKGRGERYAFLDLRIAHDLSHDAAIDACRYGRTRWIRSQI